MSDFRRHAVLVLLFFQLTGCLGYLVAESPSFVARGTWHGSVDPIVCEGENTGAHITAMQLTVSDGPALLEEGNETSVPMPTIGRRAVLVGKSNEALLWKYATSETRQIEVTGVWNSNDRVVLWKNEPVLLTTAPRAARHLNNVIVVKQIEQVPAVTSANRSISPGAVSTPLAVQVQVDDKGPAATTRHSATTQAAAITLKAKLITPDQIELKWTAYRTAASYLVEISEDGLDYHESMDMQGPATSTTMMGFEEAQSGKDHYIRVVAVDANRARIATSNVAVIRSPGR